MSLTSLCAAAAAAAAAAGAAAADVPLARQAPFGAAAGTSVPFCLPGHQDYSRSPVHICHGLPPTDGEGLSPGSLVQELSW